jgi:hypothetical protein
MAQDPLISVVIPAWNHARETLDCLACLKKFQDWDLWLTILERGGKGFWIDRVLYSVVPRRSHVTKDWIERFFYALPWAGFMQDSRKRYLAAEKNHSHQAPSVINCYTDSLWNTGQYS